jgi:hypothetical protein
MMKREAGGRKGKPGLKIRGDKGSEKRAMKKHGGKGRI